MGSFNFEAVGTIVETRNLETKDKSRVWAVTLKIGIDGLTVETQIDKPLWNAFGVGQDGTINKGFPIQYGAGQLIKVSGTKQSRMDKGVDIVTRIEVVDELKALEARLAELKKAQKPAA